MNPVLNHRPCRAWRASRLHELKSIPAGTLGLSPAEPRGRRVDARSVVVPDSQPMRWPPLPVPASILRVFLPYSSVSLYDPISGAVPVLTWNQANPVPELRFLDRTGGCKTRDAWNGQQLYRVPTAVSCGLSATARSFRLACDASARQPHGEARSRFVGQVLRLGPAAVKLGNESHDVQAQPEMRPAVLT